MSRREDWSRARRTTLQGQSKWRAERKAKDDRCSALGVQVVMALRERDAWVAECEQRAGEALVQLVDGEGLTTGEAVRWCAAEVSVPEAARLRRLVRSAGAEGATAAPPITREDKSGDRSSQ
jgi:hypothetical protein